MMSADERALKIFEGDANSEIMTSFVAFISEAGRNYKDHTETVRKYRNFRENYKTIQRYQEHAFHMPYKLSINN